ncbi:unnamed protein product [Polarella glacialis]|uniref:AB hydrolase-1 domain-containing protein n=1 Tax=Polarella glacialis TaxID=89957 RepID=A0A813G9F6_POLGL|nr:unnamed protein product [Polarella glacialis]CAE8687479.1 unnamed protein product [Polarella glacialis]
MSLVPPWSQSPTTWQFHASSILAARHCRQIAIGRGKCQMSRRAKQSEAMLSRFAGRRSAVAAVAAIAVAAATRPSPSRGSVADAKKTSGVGEVVPAFRDELLLVDGWEVPLAVWSPEPKGQANPQPAIYRHSISVKKIAGMMARWDLPPLGWTFNLQGAAVSATSGGHSNVRGGVVLCHGFLGSRFDMLHLAEFLAARGFVVVAPEMPWSLGGNVKVAPTAGSTGSRSREPPSGPALLQAASAELTRLFGDVKIGLVGHSLGSGSVAKTPAAARVIVGAGPPGRWLPQVDPLLVVCSSGDKVAGFSDADVQAARQKSVRILTPQSSSLPTEAQNPAASTPSTEALFLRKPCHISFLSAQTNDALVTLLLPLLPVARGLNIPVLDFDVYLFQRDSEETGKAWMPSVAAFFERHLPS